MQQHGTAWPSDGAASDDNVRDSEADVRGGEGRDREGLGGAGASLGEFKGNLEGCDHTGVIGWAQTEGETSPVELDVLDNDVVMMRVVAGRFRQDLLDAGIGEGRHSFEAAFSRPLSPLVAHTIAVRRAADGAALPRSPRHLPQGTALDPSMQVVLGRVLANVASLAESPAALDTAISFLEEHLEQLRQARADLVMQREEHERVRRGWPAAPRRPRALFIDEAVPDTARDAGSAALLSHMRAALRLGFEVSMTAAPLASRRGALESGLAAEGIECLCLPQDTSVEDALRRRAGLYEVVYLHRVATARRYAGLVAHYAPRARKILSVADLASLRLERQGAVEGRAELTPIVQALRREELIAASHADAVITHSTAEARLLRRHLPGGLIHAVPWAVPARPVRTPFAARRDVAFVGSYAHEPNLDAVHHLVRDVMPLVWARAPHIRALLAGSGMPDGVRALAGPRVEALGQVAGLGDLFERVRLTVAPLRFGAGIKGKVMDSLAAGIPCACSPVAAEGLDLPDMPGLVGWTPQALADAIVTLHEDEAANASAARTGLAYAAEALSEARIDALLGPPFGLAPVPA